MKLATKKQADRINKLTYKLYCKKGKENTNIIMPFKKALELTYDIASEMIEDLEIKVFLEPKVFGFKRLVNVTPITLIKNYKLIDRVKINQEEDTAEIFTIDEKRVFVPQTSPIKSDKTYISNSVLFKTLKRAIDHDLYVNIYSIDEEYYFFLKDTDRDNKLTKEVELLNGILETTKNLMVFDNKKKVYDITVMFDLIKERNPILHEKLIELDEDQIESINSLIKLAQDRKYGLAFKDEPIVTY